MIVTAQHQYVKYLTLNSKNTVHTLLWQAFRDHIFDFQR